MLRKEELENHMGGEVTQEYYEKVARWYDHGTLTVPELCRPLRNGDPSALCDDLCDEIDHLQALLESARAETLRCQEAAKAQCESLQGLHEKQAGQLRARLRLVIKLALCEELTPDEKRAVLQSIGNRE